MANPSSFLLTLLSSLLISTVHGQYYGQPPPPPPGGYSYGPPGNTIPDNGNGGTTLTIPGGPTVTLPGTGTGPATGIPTSSADGELTTHLPTTLSVTIGTTVQACAISLSLVTSLQTHTVSYVTTETIVQSITYSACQSPPTTKTLPPTTLTTGTSASTCVSGSPVTTSGYTITYVQVQPTPYVANYVPNLVWETGPSGHLIGSEELSFGYQFQAYAEYVCQFKCTGACESWFVAYNFAENYWKCIQYNALIPGNVLVSPPADVPYIYGAAYNNLCGPKPTLTALITDPFPSTTKPATPTSSADGFTTSKSSSTYKPSTSVGPGTSGGPGTGSTSGHGYPSPTTTYILPSYGPPASSGHSTSGGPGYPTSSADGFTTIKSSSTYKPITSSTKKPITTLPPLPYYGDGPPPAGYTNPTTVKTSTKPGYPVESSWIPYGVFNGGIFGGGKREERE